MLVGSKDVGNVGDQFNTVMHEWILSFLVRWLALACQDDGTQLKRSLLDVGDDEIGLKRSQPAALILAHDKLEMIFTGRKHEAGAVLHVLAANLLRGVERELDGLAHAAHRTLQLVQHLSDKVERSLVFVTALSEGNLRSR